MDTGTNHQVGDKPVDARAFRQTVGQFVTGVTVIAIDVDGTVRAMTANSFTSVSLDPPLVLFCVGKTAHLGQLIHVGVRLFREHPAARTATPLDLLRGTMDAGIAAALRHSARGKAVRSSTERWPRSAAASTRSTRAAITGSSSAGSCRSIESNRRRHCCSPADATRLSPPPSSNDPFSVLAGVGR